MTMDECNVPPSVKPVVLLVDDDQDLRELYADVMRAAGYEVLDVGSGEAAIARTATWRPHVVSRTSACPG